MRAKSVLVAAAPPALFALLGTGACSFPEVSFLDVGGSASSSTTSGGGGPGPSSSSASGPGTGGQGGDVASASSTGVGGSGTGGEGVGGQGGGGGVDCTVPDKDGDTYTATECGGNDCDDMNPDVFVGQGEWFNKPRMNGTFDYNCSGADEEEFATASCSGGLCTAKNSVFLTAGACGQMATFGDCNALCQTSNLVTKTKRCH